MENRTPPQYDVVIVGGGPAGLSAALMLGRSRRRVLVVDEGRPRNRFAGHMHGVLGRDHTSPLELLAEGRRELGRYDGVELREGSVVGAAPTPTPTATATATATAETGTEPTGFRVELDDGATVTARRLLVTSGLRDELPAVPGLAELWGRGVFVCPYCDGWEVRDGRIAVLAGEQPNPHQAQLMRQLSDEVVFLTGGRPIDETTRSGLLARGIRIEERPLARVASDADGELVALELADGEAVPVDALFVAPGPAPLDGLLRSLGAEHTEHPMGGSFVVVDAMGRTNVPGLWAAGNVTDPRSSVPFAMAGGNFTGAAMNAALVEEEIAAALAARERMEAWTSS
ncbi:NAD(P)/FAD-dependent oxidoreductase [Agromyces mediolanus]|uniref:NAD(P)/FAD-dependent oxidoreductase n=1 Tax=Agromyces mediolanus TaxID=41986 RepID=UPI00203ACB00|nr:NAD(P)/FAD-dependent oxidoreductase [Agromyces mediolanus]MCM3658810.1 NAD(P)/FAD-dependent oxidoreductase [Agromyces mediolanus]